MSGFVTITKGELSKRVSFGAYRNYYKDFGWVLTEGVEPSVSPVTEEVAEDTVDEQPEITDEVVEDSVDEAEITEDEVADEEWDEAIAEEDVEKPLSEMNRDELVAKAESLGIEVDGKNNSQLRKAIKEKM